MARPSKRRLRRARSQREALLLDLGTLVFELHREGRRAPELLQALAAELERADDEVRALEAASGPITGRVQAAAIVTALVVLCGGAAAVAAVALTDSESNGGARPEETGGLAGTSASGGMAAGGSRPRTPAASGRRLAPERSQPWPVAARRLVPTRSQPWPVAARRLVPTRSQPWPVGVSGHTVIVLTAGDRPAARAVAEEAAASGLPAGVLRSDDYDLGEGLWLVFVGQHEGAEQAARAATELAERFPGAYPQEIAEAR